MNWLDKLFGGKEQTQKKEQSAGAASTDAAAIAGAFEGLNGIRFGRYSDNNKTYNKTQRWYEAEDLYKEKRYTESLSALFDYLRDNGENNVTYKPDGPSGFTFDILQGSKRIHGECDGKQLIARVPLAKMDHPGTAVMRRMLELNYTLFYSRSALDEHNNTLYMVFDSDVPSSSPNKLYYGLRELAIKADRHDDLLLADFETLKPIGTDHIQPLSQHELQVKYNYFQKWIRDALSSIALLNYDSFAGAISYILLSAVYRIDFLITPEAKLLTDLEHIHSLYWDKKDELALVERNQLMRDALRKLLDMSKDEFAANVYRSKSTFAINTPPKPEKIKEYIINSTRDSHWYKDNKYPEIAMALCEYGVLYEPFVFSMPRVITDLTIIYMSVLHPAYFTELGMKKPLYHTNTKTFERDAITEAVDIAIARYRDKFNNINWDHKRISYDSLYEFATTFGEQMANLNLETKR